MQSNGTGGPLAGIRVVELGGIGPVQFCGMLLADLGAEVIRIERPHGYEGGDHMPPEFDLMSRGRAGVPLDLKKPEAVAAVLRLVGRADALIEGYRPGVPERLGLGPDACHAANPALVYGRMTGWGQDGPLAAAPGFDINYIALTGVLDSIGHEGGAPAIPLNLIGDFGGGALYLAFGIACALLEARQSGRGQVVDAAMVDGASSLMTLIHGMHAAGNWQARRGVNRLDSGAPWYAVYETADGRHVAIGAGEVRFYRNALALLGLADTPLPDQFDRAGWPVLRAHFAAAFRRRSRDEWAALPGAADACITPVLSIEETAAHPHIRARGTLTRREGILQPDVAPRFSRTPGRIRDKPGAAEALGSWGITDSELAGLRRAKALLDRME